jgi:hypothetical protein
VKVVSTNQVLFHAMKLKRPRQWIVRTFAPHLPQKDRMRLKVVLRDVVGIGLLEMSDVGFKVAGMRYLLFQELSSDRNADFHRYIHANIN